ncbi:hypothetical protein PFISCL1PPCAC_28127, partial [Pristionchus fissidentatus]
CLKMPRLPAPRSSLASLLGISRQFRRELSGNRRFHMSAEQNAELLAIDDEEAPKRLVKSFDIETIDTNLYRSNALVRGLVGRDAVYGGQVIGQSLRAAQDTVESDRAPHSMHCYFLQAGSVVKPIVYLVDRVREGGSFSTRIVKAIQDGKVLFTTQISFQKHEDGGMRHSRTMPEVPPPSSLLSYRDLLKEALSDHERKPSMTDHQAMLLEFKLANTPPTFHRVYEHRPVDQKIFDFSRRKGIEPQRSWIKTVVPYGDLPALQRQLAAYISDSAVIDAALFPHLARGFIPSMVFSLDHAIWFHQPAFTLDKWCLLEVESDYAGATRSYGRARIYSDEGVLLLSASQEGLVRAFKGFRGSTIEPEG